MTLKLYKVNEHGETWLEARDQTSKLLLQHVTVTFMTMGGTTVDPEEIDKVGIVALAHGWKVEIYSGKGKFIEQFELPKG